jgi:hypothetical protein
MNIRLCLWTMWETGERRLPNEVVKELGLRYARWETHPIADQIHLIDVDEKSLPAVMPSFLERFETQKT